MELLFFHSKMDTLIVFIYFLFLSTNHACLNKILSIKTPPNLVVSKIRRQKKK